MYVFVIEFLISKTLFSLIIAYPLDTYSIPTGSPQNINGVCQKIKGFCCILYTTSKEKALKPESGAMLL